MILSGFILLPLLYIVASFFPLGLRARQWGAVAMTVMNLLLAVGLIVHIATAGMVKSEMGSWEAPYGIVMVADRLSALLLLITALLGTALSVYAIQSMDTERQEKGFYQFFAGILMGVNGSFIAGDLFNLYVWFEVMLMSSFILMSHGGGKVQLGGSIKYLILNLISSFFFVAGIGLLYGQTGTLNLAHLSRIIAEAAVLPSSFNAPLVLIAIAFAIKGALFPFFFWLPASYHTPPPAVTALFAGLLTKVGIYSLIRFHTLILRYDDAIWNDVMLWIGGLSMVIGVFTATSQYDFRKILSFHIISQVGYVVLALGFSTRAAMAGAIFFLGHNMIAKTGVFLVAGWVKKRKGTLDLRRLGELFSRNKWWSVMFLIPAFSLAGIPPLSGFVGKYAIIKSGIDAHHTTAALIALFVGVFTLFSMLKIWIEVFWKPMPTAIEPAIKGGEGLMLTGAALLALATIGMGVAGAPILEYCTEAANDLFNPNGYVEFVLGRGGV
ncbi:MAG: pH regulation protein D [Marinilabiliaceae bacterium]|nr:pH regulation protein D [Marinilabiliaceae bacterium]